MLGSCISNSLAQSIFLFVFLQIFTEIFFSKYFTKQTKRFFFCFPSQNSTRRFASMVLKHLARLLHAIKSACRKKFTWETCKRNKEENEIYSRRGGLCIEDSKACYELEHSKNTYLI
ncbi:hypothetical protein V8G54_031018 [Vigna mungo]|uniref:Uncharacterized protein n=1 Tax=Vigna mungo TaxID=3915 RepID=A0AAQ3MWU6_VIGMU